MTAAHHLGQPAGAEDDQDDHENDEKFAYAHGKIEPSNVLQTG